VVQITGTATSASLESSPTFFRSLPTNHGESASLIAHLSALDFSRNFGIVHAHDACGDGFHDALLQEANRANVSMRVSVPCENSSVESIESSMKMLKNADARHVIAIVDLNSWKPVVRAAQRCQIIGLHHPDHQLHMAEHKEIQRACHQVGRCRSHSWHGHSMCVSHTTTVL